MGHRLIGLMVAGETRRDGKMQADVPRQLDADAAAANAGCRGRRRTQTTATATTATTYCQKPENEKQQTRQQQRDRTYHPPSRSTACVAAVAWVGAGTTERNNPPVLQHGACLSLAAGLSLAYSKAPIACCLSLYCRRRETIAVLQRVPIKERLLW